MKQRKVSMSIQLMRGYLTIAVLGIIMISMAFGEVQRREKVLQQTMNESLIPITFLVTTSYLMEEESQSVYQLIASNSTKEKFENFYDISEKIQDRLEEWKSIEPYVPKIEEDLSLEMCYYDFHTQLEGIVEQVQQGNYEVAKKMFESEGFINEQADLEQYFTLTIEQIEVNQKQEENMQHTRSVSVFILVMGLTVVWLLLTLGVPIFIARGIGSVIKRIISAIEAYADGKLNTRVDIKVSSTEMTRFNDALEKMRIQFQQVLQEVQEMALQVSVGSSEISEASQMFAVGATEQAAAIEEINAHMEEMTDYAKMNNQSAHQIQELSAGVKDSAEEGNHKMQETLLAMQHIYTAS